MGRKYAEGIMKDVPWMRAEAVAKLEEILRPDWTVFEWGGGGSTIWLAQRVARLVCVEQAPMWIRQIGRRLYELNLRDKVDLVHIQADAEREYDEFADHILEFPAGHFDLVLVDGKVRHKCLANAQDRVRPGGWVVLDDSQRRGYAKGTVLYETDSWEKTNIKGLSEGIGSAKGRWFMGQTTFYQKLEG
jgi:predicted O-methyltransferase YrrM